MWINYQTTVKYHHLNGGRYKNISRPLSPLDTRINRCTKWQDFIQGVGYMPLGELRVHLAGSGSVGNNQSSGHDVNFEN